MSRFQNASRPARRPALRPLCLALALAGVHAVGGALPVGPQVTQGTVTVQAPNPQQLTLQQGSQKAIIDWRSFSLAPTERLNILQPNARAVLLNRVTGQDPSLILGQISANGRIFLSNPRGIVFGESARIDVGGLLATTLDIGQHPDAQGRWLLSTPAGSTPGSIEVDGELKAPQGLLALVAPQISVRGLLQGQRVGVAAASRALVDVEGDGLIFFDVHNDGLDTRLNLLGTLQADGGSVEARAQARAGFADTVLNLDGVVQARSIGQRGGQIVIDGGDTGVTRVGGQLDASGRDAGERGGAITVLGEKLALTGTAQVDASGLLGGGTVLVGGGFQGHGTPHNAQQVYVGPAARLQADALQQGDGGTVVIWSDQSTRYRGSLSALGGPQGGNGGLAEVSGKVHLDFAGAVDLSAARGTRGRLWLDPQDLIIGNTANADGQNPTGDDLDNDGEILFGEFGNRTSEVTAARVSNLLLTTNVTLQATRDLTVETAINAPGGTGSLVLDAGRNLTVSTDVAVGGSITMRADSAAVGGNNGSGTLNLGNNVDLTATTGSITLSGAALTFTGNNSLTAGTNASLSAAAALTLPEMTLGGALTVATTAGGITDGGIIQVGADGSSFTTSAAGQAIDLSNFTHVLGGNSVAFQTSGAGGNVALRGDSIDLAASTTGGNLSATATTGNITQSGVLSVGAPGSIFRTLGNNSDIVLGTSGNSFGTISLNTTGATGNATVTSTNLTLSASSIGGNLTATATTGNIGQSGVLSLGAAGSSFTTNGNNSDIALTNAGNVFNGTTLALNTTGATGNASVTGDALVLAASSIGGNLTALASSGSITQVGALSLGAAGSSFTTQGNNDDIVLTTAGNNFAGTTLAFSTQGTNGNVDVTGNTLVLALSGIEGRLAAVANSGGISQTATANNALTVGQTGSSFTVPVGQSIDLDNQANSLAGADTAGGLVFTNATNLALRNSGDVELGALTLAGRLNVTSETGSIRSTGILSVGADGSSFTTIAAGQGIDLSGFTHAFGNSTVAFQTSGGAGAVVVQADTLNFAASTIGGSLTATATTGNISQAGVLSLGAAGSSFTTQGVNSDIVLGNTSNGFANTTLALNTSGAGGNATVAGNTLVLAASTVGGQLDAIASSGNISQTGALNLGAAGSSFTTQGANSDILLGNAGNVFGSTSLALQTTGAGGNATVVGDTLVLASSTLGGNLQATATTGGISQTGALSLGAAGSSFTTQGANQLITLTDAGNNFAGTTLGLNTNGAAADVSITGNTLVLAGASVGGRLIAEANSGGISQVATAGNALSTGVSGSSFSVAAGQSIDLGQQANTLAGAGTAGGLSFSGATNLALRDTGNVQLGTTTLAGRLNLTSDGGSISDGGVITVGADGSSFTTSGAGQSIDLDNFSHAFGAHTVAFNSANGGNVQVQADALRLAGSSIGGSLTATTTVGGISQTDTAGNALTTGQSGSSFSVAAGQSIDLSSQANSLAGAASAGGISFIGATDLALRNIGSIQLGSTTLAGRLNLTSDSGSISEAGTLTVGADGSSFTTSSNGQVIDLSTSTHAFGGHTVAFNTTGSTSHVSVRADALQLAASSIGGRLNATATSGDITQTGALSLGAAGSSFTTQAADADIVLTQADNSLGNTTLALSTSGAGGDASVTGDALVLGSSSIGGTLTAVATSGNISQSGALTLSGSSASFRTQAANSDIVLTNAGNLFGSTALGLSTNGAGGDASVVGDALNLAASTLGGKLVATAASGNITQSGVLSLGAAGSSFTTQAADADILLTLAGNLLGSSTLALTTTGTGGDASISGDALVLAASSIGGALTATASSGNISQTGALTLSAAGASFTTLGANSDIVLSQSGNLMNGGAVSLNTVGAGGDATLTGDALVLATSGVGGKLTATATTGNITQTGALNLGAAGSSFTTQGANSDILLDQAGNALANTTLALSTTGATGNATVVGDTLSFAASTLGGTLTATSLAGGIGQTGVLSLGADGSLFTAAANQSIDLSTQANLFGSRTLGFATSGSGAVLVRSDSLNLATSTIGGDFTALIGGGDLTQTGALSVGGSSTLRAVSGTVDVALTDAANQLGTVQLQGIGGSLGTVALRQAGDLTVGGNAQALTLNSSGAVVLTGGSHTTLTVNAQGDISQTGALSVSGLTTLGTETAGITVALTQADNELTQLNLAPTGAGSFASVSLRDRDLSRIDGLSVGGPADSLVVDAGGAVQLSGGTLGSLSVTAGGNLSQSGDLLITGSAQLLARSAGLDASLARAGNQIAAVTLGGTGGGSWDQVLLQTSGALSLAGQANALSVTTGGALQLGSGAYGSLAATVGGAVSQSGGLAVTGITTLTAQGANLDVTLDGGGGSNELHTVALQNGSGSFGSVQVVDTDQARPDGLRISGQAASLAVQAGGAVTLGAGQYGQLSVDTSANGAAIGQTAALVVSGTTQLAAGSGSISLARSDNQFGSIRIDSAQTASLSDSDGYSLGDSVVSSALTLDSAGTIQVTGRISGAATLTKTGSGTLAITSDQGWSGGTQLQAGTLSLSGATASLGAGAVQLASGTVLALGPDVALANQLTSQGATLRQLSGRSALSGDLVLTADSTLDVAGGATLALQGGISGTGQGLNKTGAGTAELSGPNTADGLLAVTEGRLLAAATGSLAGTGAVRVDAGATLALGADVAIGSLAGAGEVELGSARLTTGADQSSTVFAGQLNGSGGLSKVGSGTFTLSGDNLYTGATRVEGGSLATASAQRLADATAVVVSAGATLQLGGAETIGSLAGGGTVNLAGHRVTLGGDDSSTTFSGALTGSGAFTKIGDGNLTLSGSNTLAGTMIVGEGELTLASAQALTAGNTLQVGAAGAVQAQEDLSLAALNGTGSLTLAGTELSLGLNNASGRFDGQLHGSGTLSKTGSGTSAFGGSSDFSGLTQVLGGTLLIDGQFTGLPSLFVAGAGTLALGADQRFAALTGSGAIGLASHALSVGADGSDTVFAGTLSGSGQLVKQGSGSLTLAGNNLYSGGTVIDSGTLQLGQGGSSGTAGTGAIVNDGLLRVVRADSLQLDAAITGSGALELAQGTLTLGATGNAWTGDTRVLAGQLRTAGAERLPDSTDLTVAAGASLVLGGAERLGSLDAAGTVSTNGNILTSGAQTYAGGLTVRDGQSVLLSGTVIEAGTEQNSLGTGTLSVQAERLNLHSAAVSGGHADLVLGDVQLAGDSRITAGRIVLDGAFELAAGTLLMTADAAPDPDLAELVGTARAPGTLESLAWSEVTVAQRDGSALRVAEGARLQIVASGGGSVNLMQDANQFSGSLSVLSGAAPGTAWSPVVVRGITGIPGITVITPVSRVQVAGDTVRVGDNGIEADTVHIRANTLTTLDEAALVARMPFDNLILGTSQSAPSMVLELAPNAFDTGFPFGRANEALQVVVGARATGDRSSGPDGGFLMVLPKGGARGSTAVFLAGPLVGSGSGYAFFHDGSGQQTEIPVFYNGNLPKSPQVAGSLSAVAAVSESARRDRFEEAVRTENVTVRLRSGVIAEVGPGRPATVGAEGAATPQVCEPQANALACRP